MLLIPMIVIMLSSGMNGAELRTHLLGQGAGRALRCIWREETGWSVIVARTTSSRFAILSVEIVELPLSTEGDAGRCLLPFEIDRTNWSLALAGAQDPGGVAVLNHPSGLAIAWVDRSGRREMVKLTVFDEERDSITHDWAKTWLMGSGRGIEATGFVDSRGNTCIVWNEWRQKIHWPVFWEPYHERYLMYAEMTDDGTWTKPRAVPPDSFPEDDDSKVIFDVEAFRLTPGATEGEAYLWYLTSDWHTEATTLWRSTITPEGFQPAVEYDPQPPFELRFGHTFDVKFIDGSALFAFVRRDALTVWCPSQGVLAEVLADASFREFGNCTIDSGPDGIVISASGPAKGPDPERDRPARYVVYRLSDVSCTQGQE